MSRPAPGAAKKPSRLVESSGIGRARENPPKPIAVQKSRSKEYANAIQSYEAGLKLMHAEEYEKAIRIFRDLIADHPEEPEIQERARVLMQASDKKLLEKSRTVLRSADDHYNMGIAELNRRQLDAAVQHLHHALKLAPKGDHILYAMAAANALKGNRDEALSFLKQSIHHRPENRFMAARDSDFEILLEDPDFKQLITSPEK
jgi:tetratricopeptide (TPR) repeat protein